MMEALDEAGFETLVGAGLVMNWLQQTVGA